MLTQATQDIKQYFPDLSFTATWVLVATWDRVEYVYHTDTVSLFVKTPSGSSLQVCFSQNCCDSQCSQTLQETSFQVVLISGGDLSFVLMNYGDCASSNKLVQVKHA